MGITEADSAVVKAAQDMRREVGSGAELCHGLRLAVAACGYRAGDEEVRGTLTAL
jgi:hypothetical protein